jgi:drug/metabolite transporter (DMT)-like permease
MAISPSQRWPVVALVGSSVMWGGMWWPLKQINALGIGGIPLVVCAFGAASLLLLPALMLQHRRWAGEGRFLLLIALLGGYANIAYTEALIYGEVVRVMVLFYLVPVWGVLGGRLFLGERIDWIRGLGVVLALSGAFVILGGFKVLTGRIAWTDLLAVTCGMAFAGNNLVFRARQAPPVSSKVAAMLLGTAVLALPLVLLIREPWPQVAPSSWGWVAAYGIAWMLVATAATQWAVTHMEAGRASTLIILELVTAVVSATLIGGERMGPGEWFGSVLVVAAALLEAWRAEPGRPAAATA